MYITIDSIPAVLHALPGRVQVVIARHDAARPGASDREPTRSAHCETD